MERELLETLVALIEASEAISPDETNIKRPQIVTDPSTSGGVVLLLQYKGNRIGLVPERF